VDHMGHFSRANRVVRPGFRAATTQRPSMVFSRAGRWMESVVPRIGRCCLAAAVVAWLASVPGLVRLRAQDASIAVVVNPSNTETGMTSAELCDTLLGDRQRWTNGKLIQVFVPPAGSDEWKVVVRAVCRTSESGFRRQVGSSRAFGHASRPPQVIKTAAEMKQRVAASERALGFVPASQLENSVKALSIDGKSPSDSDYPIRTPTLSNPAKDK
jgi:ABC-type phosphate transport system substrate-binding protein